MQLFNVLSEEATGLRFIELGWGASCDSPEQLRGARGLGHNVLFVRALAKMRQLEKLRITGHYAKQWPSYLRKEMGVQVHAVYDLCNECAGSAGRNSALIERMRADYTGFEPSC